MRLFTLALLPGVYPRSQIVAMNNAELATVVLWVVTGAGTARTFLAHGLLIGHAFDTPHGEVVENDGLLADGRVVESAPANVRLLETGRVYETVIVDWLLL